MLPSYINPSLEASINGGCANFAEILREESDERRRVIANWKHADFKQYAEVYAARRMSSHANPCVMGTLFVSFATVIALPIGVAIAYYLHRKEREYYVQGYKAARVMRQIIICGDDRLPEDYPDQHWVLLSLINGNGSPFLRENPPSYAPPSYDESLTAATLEPSPA